MGCAQSSQLGPVTSPAPAAKQNAPAPVTNGVNNVRPVTAHPKNAENGGVVATTMDELNVEYTTMRLLLLGAAESGKTTLLEQIRLLYKQNYSEAEFIHRKAFIYNNILISIRKLIEHMQNTGTAYDDPNNARYAGRIMGEEDTQFSCFTADMADAIQHVWKDGAVQKLYLRRSEINLNDSTK
ncbi:unnamed protein product [Cylicocyclus nassatus]|uniref:Uncharacterized protein n=1 Tax=Cylicocyclus nassatus TaxID=53992 RepID=A0AA36GGG6_CYLNA|nr:unnamed protein product [Cylicocyclus nassatus]